jgi:magnesium chelatase family protein
MLARRLPGILPRLSLPEAIEVTKIHSVAGALRPGAGLIGAPPFRAPHHGISSAGLVGGGPRPAPGEASLAHRGVLFLDELPEFRRDVLEALRQPLEERRVSVVRARGAVVFPCDVLLIAAMNPCPCGFLGDPRRACTCDPRERLRYARKLSGPLLDRIDLHVNVGAVGWKDLREAAPAETTDTVLARVLAARERSGARRGTAAGFRNADLTAQELVQHCALDHAGSRLLENAVARIGLSVRAVHRGLRVARTIADLAQRERVNAGDLAEALSFRAPALARPCSDEQVDTPRAGP